MVVTWKLLTLDVSSGDPQYKQSLLILNVDTADLKLGDSNLLSLTFGLYAAISPINTWRILMKLRMEIPVRHAHFVWQQIEHGSTRSRPQNTCTSLFETSGCSWCKYLSVYPCRYDAWLTVLHHVTSNITRLLHVSKFVNFVPIDLKTGTHID